MLTGNLIGEEEWGETYQQVLFLTINIGRADGIKGFVVFSNSSLSLLGILN